VGAWSAALFHFMTHALFKALLFLAAGVIIFSLRKEHDIFRMGGLRRQLPLTFWTFLAGAASLAALPLITAGFYSKDAILFYAWNAPTGGVWLWAAGLAGALLTSLYTFRLVFIAFFGEARQQITRSPGPAMQLPLVILAVLSLTAGLVNLPRTLGDVPLLSDFLRTALPGAEAGATRLTEVVLQIVASLTSLLGVYLAYALFYRCPRWMGALAATPVGSAVHRFWLAGWGFDWLYDTLLVRPYAWLARIDRRDVVDAPFAATAWLGRVCWQALARTQTGYVRWYAAALAVGAIVAIAVMGIL
jgi:NADH-quinone oxidoreductase subunit L